MMLALFVSRCSNSCHFAAARKFGRFWGEADIRLVYDGVDAPDGIDVPR